MARRSPDYRYHEEWFHMKTLIPKTGVFAATAALAVLLSGCVTNEEMAETRAMAEEAKANSDLALQKAEEANEKIDRMFKKSMYK
jgi:hypothetical protein